MPVNTKALIAAPCGYVNSQKSETVIYPQINCGYDCKNCGFNPAEAKRRIEQGEWREVTQRVNPETGTIIRISGGVKGLYFKRDGVNEHL